MQTEFQTNISAVIVYPGRARILRKGSAEITQQTRQLKISNLPLSLNVDSVRVTGSGSAHVVIRSVDTTLLTHRETPVEKVRAIQAKIESVNDEIRVVDDEIAGLNAQMEYLDGLRTASDQYARAIAYGRMKAQDQVELLGFLQEQDKDLRAKIRSAEKNLHELGKTLTHLQKQLGGMNSQRPKRSYETIVEVKVRQAGVFNVELSYVVNSASWTPLYDVRLDQRRAGPALEMTALAQVKQRSGEDWQGVDLTLSTARPALNQRRPVLKPWFIDEFRPQPVRAKRMRSAPPPQPMAAQMDAMMAEPAMEPVAEEVAADVETATVDDSGASVTYHVGGGIDIPSDGSTHKTTLGEYEFFPQLDFISIPKHTDSVFRRVKLNNTTGVTLLPGSVSLFVDNEFIGKNNIDLTAPKGEIELFLGVEDRITVKRELQKRQVDKRLLRDSRQIRYGYSIHLNSALPYEITMSVEDQIPVSRNELIKVEIAGIRPQPNKTSELNLMTWNLKIGPDSTEIIRYEYVVEHPRAIRVSGLKD